MGSLFSYSLAASLVVILMFPIIYRLVNHSTAFRFNRAAILTVVALAMLFPAIHLIDFAPTANIQIGKIASVAQLTSGETIVAGHSLDIISILIIAYMSVVAALIIREAVSYFRLSRLISSAEQTDEGSYILSRVSDDKIAPFSWGRFIVIPKSNDVAQSIIMHEKAHIVRRHCIDIALLDLFCIFTWYNPFSWIIKNLTALNHEFEADEAVIASGVDTLEYQRLLVSKAIGHRTMPLVNNFAIGSKSFRKRVLSMSRPRSKRHLWPVIMAVATLVIAAVILTHPVSAKMLESFSNHKLIPENMTGQKIIVNPIEEQVAEDSIDTVIESPLVNQQDLAQQLTIAFSKHEFDNNAPITKIMATIVIDEQGFIKEVSTNESGDAKVRTIIEKALTGVKFECTNDENGKPIEIRYALPITITNK